MGCKDVMFVSDDEVRNQIVEGAWGFKTELIEPRDINKKLKGMKFDLIISTEKNKAVYSFIMDKLKEDELIRSQVWMY